MIAALPLSVSAAGEYVPGNPRWSGYQNQVQWGRPAGAASGDSFEYEAQLLLGDDVVESKAVEIDTYLFFTNDVVTRPQEEYTIRVRARWIMIVGDPDGQYMVADVGEAEPPHEHSYTQKHDAAQHWQACSCGERLNVANHQSTLLLLWELVLLEGLPNVPKVGGEVTACQFHRVVRQVAPLIAGVEIPVEGEVQLQLHWVGLENTEVVVLQVEGRAFAVVPVHQEPARRIDFCQCSHGAVRHRFGLVVG